VPLGDRAVEGALFEAKSRGGVTVYFLAHDHYYDRDGLYGPRTATTGTIASASLLLPGGLEAVGRRWAQAGWRPQVIHVQ
jgi:glycogen synthase